MAKQPVRIVIPVWGEKYLNNVFSYTFPALLAPGNLPALVQDFACTVAFVTEERFFDRIRLSPVWKRMEKVAEAQLLPIDDLIAYKNHYGISLTQALMRGFEELGSKMTETYLLFFNSDFILADGSCRTLAARMLAGERLIHAPSYCVIEEEIAPEFTARLAESDTVLAVPPREMASLILAHRHFTIRAMTINQRVFRMHRQMQFYLQANPHTLFAYQLPTALVCMKPERMLTELKTFWDFGVVSEFCPTTKPCILGDSDDFLMAELRDANGFSGDSDAFRNCFRLGWASTDEIGADLSTFSTKDQRDHGRYMLVLHDKDLPAKPMEGQSELSAFVEAVLKAISTKPISHLNHPYWTAHYPAFARARAAYWTDKAKYSCLRQLSEKAWPVADPVCEKEISPNGVLVEAHVLSEGFVERVRAHLFGRMPMVKPTHPYYALLQQVRNAISECLVDQRHSQLIVAADSGEAIVPQLVQNYSRPAGATVVDGRIFLKEKWQLNSAEHEELAGTFRNTQFDVCVFDLGLHNLLRFKQIYSRVLPFMKPGGRIIVFHLSATRKDLWMIQPELVSGLPYMDGLVTISFAGSRLIDWALGIYSLGGRLRSRHRIIGLVVLAALSIFTMPFIWIGNKVSMKNSPNVMPRPCLSLLLECRLF